MEQCTNVWLHRFTAERTISGYPKTAMFLPRM